MNPNQFAFLILFVASLMSIANVNAKVDLQQNGRSSQSRVSEQIIMSNVSALNGDYNRVYFLYLYGASADDIDPVLPIQSNFNSTHRAYSPFLKVLNDYSKSEPQNCFYKRVQVNGNIQDQQSRLQNLMTGSEISQMIYDIQVADPLTYFKDIDDYFQNQSIIDQILSLKNSSFTEESLDIESPFLGFTFNGKSIQLSSRFYKNKEEDQLNQEESLSKLLQNPKSLVNNTKNIQKILSMMNDSKQDIIMAYDDTLAKIKSLFDDSSVQVFNIYQRLNELLQITLQKITNDTILIVMGEESKQNKLNGEESKHSLGRGESFMFAYSKQGFVQHDIFDQIDSAEQRNKLIREAQLNITKNYDDDDDDVYINFENIYSYAFNADQDHQTQKNYTFYHRSPSTYIQDQSIASTLSLFLGLDIPTSNNGRNILKLMPKRIQNENGKKLINTIFDNSYKNLQQQITLLKQLQEDYDFFNQKNLKIIDKKYEQILANQDTVSDLIIQEQQLRKLHKEKLLKIQEEVEKMNTEQVQKLQEEIDQLEINIKHTQNLIKGHFCLIVDLQDYLYHLLSGNKSITTSLTIAYIFVYASAFFFALSQFFKQMTNLYDNQKQKIAYLTKQLSIILPLTVLGYYIFYLYSAKNINESVVFICITIFSVLFLIEAAFLRQKLDLPKLFLNLLALYYAFDSITKNGLTTVGFWLHLFLRLRFGTAYKDYQSIKQVIIAIFMFFVSAFRLVTFNYDSLIIDAALLFIVYKNKLIKYSDKLCFLVLIITQYMYNFTDDTQEEVGQYLIFGIPTFLIVMIIQLYESIALTLSFNKFFITNIIFIYFLNIIIGMRQSLTNNDQLICCLIFYLPSYVLIILTEKDSFQQIQQFIVQFVSHKTYSSQTLSSDDLIYFELKEMLNDLESQSSPQKNQGFKFNNLIPQEEQQQTEQTQTEAVEQKNEQKDENKHKQSISYLWHVNLNKFGIYTLSGVLQLLIIMISFSQIFSDQYLLNPTLITHSKIGLIQYSILQYLIALLCILVSNQLKKTDSSIQIKNEQIIEQTKSQQSKDIPLTEIKSYNKNEVQE